MPVTDSTKTPAAPRILVVDDNDDNRYTLTLNLDLAGYRNVVTANDGPRRRLLFGPSPT